MGFSCDRDRTVIQNLRDANCDNVFIEQFLAISTEDRTLQLRLLKKRRAGLLHVIHENERYLECLDYLIYHITREKKTGEEPT